MIPASDDDRPTLNGILIAEVLRRRAPTALEGVRKSFNRDSVTRRAEFPGFSGILARAALLSTREIVFGDPETVDCELIDTLVLRRRSHRRPRAERVSEAVSPEERRQLSRPPPSPGPLAWRHTRKIPMSTTAPAGDCGVKIRALGSFCQTVESHEIMARGLVRATQFFNLHRVAGSDRREGPARWTSISGPSFQSDPATLLPILNN